jgi:hypothetical protein
MRDIFVVMAVVAILSPVPSSADSRQVRREVRIVNDTGYGIRFIGVNAPGDEDWSRNRIIGAIRNGTSAQVSLREDGTCKRDIRIAWTRKIAPTILRDVDLCSVRAVTLRYNQDTGAVSYEKR